MKAPGHFLQVFPDHVAALGGDANLAVVWSFIAYRTNPDFASTARAGSGHHYEESTGWWFRATYEDIADGTGHTAASTRRRVERLVELGAIERTKGFSGPGAGYWHRALPIEDLCNLHGVDEEKRANCTPADHANCTVPATLSSFSKKEVEEEGKEPAGDDSPAASTSVVHVPASVSIVTDAQGLGEEPMMPAAPSPEEVRKAADHWLRTAWDKRVADGRGAPVLASGKEGTFIALRKIIERMIVAGQDPREIALAVYFNDGAWTINALMETMRRRRSEKGTAAESSQERGSRLSALADRIERGENPLWARPLEGGTNDPA